MNIPFLDLTKQYRAMKKDIDGAILGGVASGRYIGGDEVRNLEEEIAQYSGARHGISVSSGTDALLASLIALGVGEGDEVITSTFTFIASAEVISLLRARPVFVDIEKDTFNLDPDLIEPKITERTRCIMPVHLFGHMANIEKVLRIAKKYKLGVIEDAAQAIGSACNGRRAGSFGDTGCFSFFPSKNLGAFGDGGFVLTNDSDVAHKIAMIKEHGSEKRYHHSIVGINGRLDTIQAAILRIKLKYLDHWAEKRREHAAYYNERLKEHVTVPVSHEGYYHVFNQYSILTKRRDELISHLASKGVPTAVYYPIPLHLQKVFSYLGYREGDFPTSEGFCKEIVSLPVFPELTENEREYIADSVVSFYQN
jgi:dTDP-4-amino-4,6-dideoxygalactose transaminase